MRPMRSRRLKLGLTAHREKLAVSREPDSATESGVRRRITQVAAMLAVLALVLFAGAGTLNWLWAWMYLGLTLLGVAATAVVMRDQRETIAECSRAKRMKDWDRAVGGLRGSATSSLFPCRRT